MREQQLIWAYMRIDNKLSGFTNIERGVQQGCVLSADLFNLYRNVCCGAMNIGSELKAGEPSSNSNRVRYIHLG